MYTLVGIRTLVFQRVFIELLPGEIFTHMFLPNQIGPCKNITRDILSCLNSAGDEKRSLKYF
jgi:hypothetical protein